MTKKHQIIIRFSGDSGDGMQLTGSQFSDASAVAGNDISTFPDYPAEIRAPAGTIGGVSGFQVQIADHNIYTPGDEPDVLVAMNPAALATCLESLPPGATLILNEDAFTKANLKKANFTQNPLEDESLKNYQVHPVRLTHLTREVLDPFTTLTRKEKDRSKNLFALGLCFWLFDRPIEPTIEWLQHKFAKNQVLVEANTAVLKAGYHFGETSEAFQNRTLIQPASLPTGTYRKITGNEALAIGLVTAAQLADKPLVFNSYPITPASDILHFLVNMCHFDIRTFQAEDEIAAMGATVGAAFGGALSCTSSSGPGIALKSEALNLAVAMELPLVVLNVQRAGPSTGLPTKTEQSDLMMALYGRNGESPLPVIAPLSPSDCFETAIEAFRLAVRAMTPVMLLSDGFLANSSEPWKIPDPDKMAPIFSHHPTKVEGFAPYQRTASTLSRPWALPGTFGLEHRVGGLGKAPVTGAVSYRPEDHQQMILERQQKIENLQQIIPPAKVYGKKEAKVLVVGWGSTYGSIRTAVEDLLEQGHSIAHLHLRHLNPWPENLGEIFADKTVLVLELNMGQLHRELQAHFARPFHNYGQTTGKPYSVRRVKQILLSHLTKEKAHA